MNRNRPRHVNISPFKLPRPRKLSIGPPSHTAWCSDGPLRGERLAMRTETTLPIALRGATGLYGRQGEWISP